MATPTGWWHHHAIPVLDKEETTCIEVLSVDIDHITNHHAVTGDCHVCSHHYSVFTKTNFFFSPEIFQPVIISPFAFYQNQYEAFSFIHQPNKGPPAC